ncbi:hypothetical protein FNF27_07110 [Cafeteria roenbergensis]|uniref:Cilia- and flagella-associated protein 58 central coiled coil domain-containing protein n=3 Tax=Cafeteria roenbergensis TaxID=33653 RepID=A0A5A8DY89_CAFRO|nr:hypothetical protein FNF29_04462 [Cafeteria roenbergensis]KAA0161410.1 hypothetical protein FNF31_03869 [Cafeteria roenbergensis]KAA0168760.1 hypothetical protein FNF27_07110 [Cafeteria roenbergensis]|eukprot:KAA0151538.1 hypothetical protein FNF29_04462 [Cafeteria roenbergensis]
MAAAEVKAAGAMDGGDDYDDTQAFDALEKDFQRVLDELTGDDTLQKFRGEYSRLFDALKKAQANERRLVKKIREQNTEAMANAAKVASALRISEDDDSNIEALRKQVERAYAMVEAANAKEEAAQTTVERLQADVEQLNGVVKRYTGLLGEDNTLEDVMEARDAFKRRYDEAADAAKYERQRADDLLSRLEARKEKLKEQRALVSELRAQLQSREEEEAREAGRQARLRAEVDKVKDTLSRREREAAELEREYQRAVTDAEAMQDKIEGLQDLAQTTANQMTLATKDRLAYKKKAEEAERRIADLQRETARQRDEARRAKQESARVDAEKRRVLAKLAAAETVEASLRRQIADHKSEAATVRAAFTEKEKEAETGTRALGQAQNQVSRLEHAVRQEAERVRIEATRKMEAEEAAAETEAAAKRTESELEKYARVNADLNKKLFALDRVVSALKRRILDLEAARSEAADTVKAREAQVKEAEKREAAAEGRLRQQKTLYDEVRNERNRYSKKLIASRDENTELRRKIRTKTRQAEQLELDNAAKDRTLVAVRFDSKTSSKKLEDKAREADELRGALVKAQREVQQLRAVVAELNAAVKRMDAEAAEQRRTAGKLVNERDMVGMQLIRRNDEVALLHEKIDIMESTLKKGAAQYSERLEDMRVLKLKVGDLRRQLVTANTAAGRVESLQRQIVQLQRELMAERTKTKALAEELENPMNVHRWRRLEGSDPSTYELVQKVQTLQRRLISKTQEAVEKEVAIQEKERLYAELKELLARQPGPEMAQRLAAFQKALRERTRQMRAMASELNMSQAQVEEYRFEVTRLEHDLTDARKRFYETRRRQALAGQRAAASAAAGSEAGLGGTAPAGSSAAVASETGARLAATQVKQAQAAAPRFVGGGFNTRMGSGPRGASTSAAGSVPSFEASALGAAGPAASGMGGPAE